MKKKKPLARFYAVTLGGVYEARAERDENGCPMVIKIKSFKRKSHLGVGGRLKNGYLLGITLIGLILYNEEHPQAERTQKIEYVNTAYWGGGTSSVVALFTNKKKACAVKVTEDQLEVCCKKWQAETEKVLEAIGRDHPVFVPSEYYDLKVIRDADPSHNL